MSSLTTTDFCAADQIASAAANLLAQLFEVAPWHAAVQPTIALYRQVSEPDRMRLCRGVLLELMAADVLEQTALAAAEHPTQIGRARAELAAALTMPIGTTAAA